MTAPDLNSTCQTIIDGRRAARALADWARRFDLSEPEFLVLWCLRNITEGGVDQTTIAQWLALSPAQVSATVERMNSRNWIVQYTGSSDRRRRLWQLSSSSRALWSAVLNEVVLLRQTPPGQEAAA